jgi:hypothetical protein
MMAEPDWIIALLTLIVVALVAGFAVVVLSFRRIERLEKRRHQNLTALMASIAAEPVRQSLQAMPLAARLVVAEYNPRFAPPIDWVMSYNAHHAWDGSDHYGASLTAFTALMAEKGYSLVGCNLSGVNAFFVRNDLVGDRFLQPFSAETHYEPARYWLMAAVSQDGHRRNYRPP